MKADYKKFLATKSSKALIFINGSFLILFFFTISTLFEVSNIYLFTILMFGQVYFLTQGLSYLFMVWDMDIENTKSDAAFSPSVDIFITVCGEPVEVVKKTTEAALNVDYKNFKVHILNDGKVANCANWKEINQLAETLGVNSITRSTPGGAKAGNINNALTLTTGKIIVILDADHVPKKQLLKKLIAPFKDPKMGFVQSPQFYKNHKKNNITSAAWAQQELFFGAISRGKNRLNATTMSGTNMAISRECLSLVGGMNEENIAEDFLTGLLIHAKGYKSKYVPEILACGLSPEDYYTYHRQQLRWAKGNLEVLVKHNPFFIKGLSFKQRIGYIASATYYLQGFVILSNSVLPVIFFFTGLVPFSTDTMLLASVFIPFIFVTIFTLQQSSNFTYTFEAMAFSISSFSIHLHALIETILGKQRGFAVSSKVKIEGNYPGLVAIQILYIFLVIFGSIFYLYFNGLTPAFVTNFVWSSFYIICFSKIITAAIPDIQLYLNKLVPKVKFFSFLLPEKIYRS